MSKTVSGSLAFRCLKSINLGPPKKPTKPSHFFKVTDRESSFNHSRGKGAGILRKEEVDPEAE
jgi:hypothetical protein